MAALSGCKASPLVSGGPAATLAVGEQEGGRRMAWLLQVGMDEPSLHAHMAQSAPLLPWPAAKEESSPELV